MADMNDRAAGSLGGRANTGPTGSGQGTGFSGNSGSNGAGVGSNGNSASSQSTPRRRGFAAMDPARQKEIASKGGRAAHEKGTAHEWSREEARSAGRKGGEVVSRDRAHMAAIGREGGGARGANARARAAGGNDQLRAPGAGSMTNGRPQERERTIPTSSDTFRGTSTSGTSSNSNTQNTSNTTNRFGSGSQEAVRDVPRGTDEHSSR